MYGFFKRNCMRLQKFLPAIQSPLDFAARSCRDLSSLHYIPGTGILGWQAWCGAGTLFSWDIPPEFLSTTHGWGTSLFCDCTLPTSLNRCGFFNSIVVILPFNLISDGLKLWLFYILVVILMWLCKEVSHICLCCHLDRKSSWHFLIEEAWEGEYFTVSWEPRF